MDGIPVEHEFKWLGSGTFIGESIKPTPSFIEVVDNWKDLALPNEHGEWEFLTPEGRKMLASSLNQRRQAAFHNAEVKQKKKAKAFM